MAFTAKLYGQSGTKAMFSGGPFKVMLCTSSYTPNQDTHKATSDITGEVTGAGYTTGGKTVPNAAVTYSAASKTNKLDGDDISWTGLTATARYAVVYAGTALLGYVDFGSDQVATGGTATITWDSAGIATDAVS